MKTKPIFISIASIFLFVNVFLFTNCRHSAKSETAEINQFLNNFNRYVKTGSTDSLLACFAINEKPIMLKRLVNLLEGKKNINGKEKPIFNLNLDIEADNVKIVNDEFTEVSIPVNFSHDNLSTDRSALVFKIKKIASHQFKIVHADTKQFLTDYLAYQDFVVEKTVSTQVVFSPITMAAFKTAESLKTKYDSIVWFAHVNNKTFFYVVKGKWNMDKDINRDKDSVIEPYKMGLVNPDLKEIIPPEYDLIHNISGTFPNLVEVEKGNKKGFYDLNGKIIIPVGYDEIYPIDDDVNLAVLKNGDDYFYLKNDMGISEKVDLKISDFLSRVKNLNSSYDLYSKALSVITEYNSVTMNGAIYVSPSYLAEMNIIEKEVDFNNPLRKVSNDDEQDGLHQNYKVGYAGKSEKPENWLEATFYTIQDYFLGGRSGFYDKKNIIIVDKKRNRMFTQDIATDYTPEGGAGLLEATCDVNSIKVINDSLFEVKAGAVLWFDLYDTTKSITGGAHYHYLALKNNRLVELPDSRNFGFTKYVKMDDSYLSGCYNMTIGSGGYDKRKNTKLDHITPEMLRYMKNEIYADYAYQFKDKRWEEVFEGMPSYSDHLNKQKSNNTTVDDSLTVIDKYNINWINQKLKEGKTKPNTLAAK